jgi:hypothetical protein
VVNCFNSSCLRNYFCPDHSAVFIDNQLLAGGYRLAVVDIGDLPEGYVETSVPRD